MSSPAAQPPHVPGKPSPRQRRLAKQHAAHLEERRRLHRQEQHKQHQQAQDPGLPSAAAAPAASRRQQQSAAPALQLDCPHFAACSGCTLQTAIDQPPVFTEARAFFAAECGFPGLELTAGPAHGWRHRARLAVRGVHTGDIPCSSKSAVVVGLFAEGSHAATDIPSCVVHHPAINAAVHLLKAALADCGTLPYDEATGSGQLRYVQATVVEHSGSTPGPGEVEREQGTAAFGLGSSAPCVQLVLVWNGSAGQPAAPGSASLERLQALAGRLWQLDQEWWHATGQQQRQQEPLLHSVWANFQPSQTNTILGDDWRLLHGEEAAWARLGGADVCFGPGSFLQANPGAMDRALAAMHRFVPPGSTIADLHAGVGTIGLSLAATCQPRWVRFVEINGQGLPPFRQSAARLQRRLQEDAPGSMDGAGQAVSSSLEGSSSGQAGAASGADGDGDSGACFAGQDAPSLEYHVAAAGSDPGRWCQGAEVVVLDPPRKGLEPALLSWLCGAQVAPAGVRRLLYLSCGFAALRRDCAALLGSGRWRLQHAEAHLFFPGSNHIETLCVFEAVTG